MPSSYDTNMPCYYSNHWTVVFVTCLSSCMMSDSSLNYVIKKKKKTEQSTLFSTIISDNEKHGIHLLEITKCSRHSIYKLQSLRIPVSILLHSVFENSSERKNTIQLITGISTVKMQNKILSLNQRLLPNLKLRAIYHFC